MMAVSEAQEKFKHKKKKLKTCPVPVRAELYNNRWALPNVGMETS